jgi:hypothetical protein
MGLSAGMMLNINKKVDYVEEMTVDVALTPMLGNSQRMLTELAHALL